jgi:hypothetical protein
MVRGDLYPGLKRTGPMEVKFDFHRRIKTGPDSP